MFYDKNHYNDWLFIYMPMADRGGLLVGPVNPSMPTGNLGGLTPGQMAGRVDSDKAESDRVDLARVVWAKAVRTKRIRSAAAKSSRRTPSAPSNKLAPKPAPAPPNSRTPCCNKRLRQQRKAPHQKRGFL